MAITMGADASNAQGNRMSFWTGANGDPTESMAITTNGNVGIGTSSPGAKLDVVGTAKLGSTGVAVTAMGACKMINQAITNSPSTHTCTGAPTESAVHCSGSAAFQQSFTQLYCRVSAADTLSCGTQLANNITMDYYCMWIKP